MLKPMSVADGKPSFLSLFRRKRERERYDQASVYAVLDAAPFCHVATVRRGRPVLLPMAHGRIGDRLILHGSPAAGLFRDTRQGSPVCVTATILDGLVLAGTARPHSMNYRSVTVYGTATLISAQRQILAGMRALIEHVTPGRWDDLPAPADFHIRETALWQVEIAEASVEQQAGGPPGLAAGLANPAWTGQLPVQLSYGQPIGADGLPAGTEPPDYSRR
jgi:uncharacterized protein